MVERKVIIDKIVGFVDTKLSEISSTNPLVLITRPFIARAVNAQYHDYIRMYKQWFPNLTEEQLDEKIIHSAINFWFEDEDAGSGKVWNYFKDI